MSIIFDGSFTSGWVSRNGVISNWKYSCIVASNRFQSLPSYLGRTNVGKFEIRNGDTCNTYNLDQRNMVQTWGHTGLTLGETIWIGFSFMLDPTWKSNNTWTLFWQFGTPTESLTLNSSNLFAYHKSVGTSSTIKTITTGVWYDVVIQLKLSTGSDGYYEVWINNQKVHSSSGYTVFDDGTNTHGLSHAVSIYRGATATNTQIAYFADYKVGTNRNDVEYNSDIILPPPPEPTDLKPVCSFLIQQSQS